MAFLIVGGVTIPVAWPDGEDNDIEEIGDRERAFAGNLLSSIRARKNTWSIRTRLLTTTERDAIRAVLEETPPIACSGDMLGGFVNCAAAIHSDVMTTVSAGRRCVLSFDLIEI